MSELLITNTRSSRVTPMFSNTQANLPHSCVGEPGTTPPTDPAMPRAKFTTSILQRELVPGETVPARDGVNTGSTRDWARFGGKGVVSWAKEFWNTWYVVWSFAVSILEIPVQRPFARIRRFWRRARLHARVGRHSRVRRPHWNWQSVT